MLAVTEFLPVGPKDILAPPAAGDTAASEELLVRTVHNDSTWYPSARTALRAALVDAGIGEDDEVLIPGYTCYAVKEAVADVATPVYVDVTETYTMNLDYAAERVTDDTTAIVPIHQYGLECDMDAVGSLADDHDLVVVEDAAQAVSNLVLSEQVGTKADYTVVSFRYFKDITTYAGGLLLGSDLAAGAPRRERPYNRTLLGAVWLAHEGLRRLPGSVYERLRSGVLDPIARSSSNALGETEPMTVEKWHNRIVATQLDALEDRVRTRRENARTYRDRLPDAFGQPPATDRNTYVRYPITVPQRRDAFLSALRRASVGASPMWAYTLAPEGTCPRSHRNANRIVNLPVHSGLSETTVRQVSERVRQAWASVTN